MSEGRWVLLIASEVGRTDSVSDRAMERLVDAIAEEGYEVVRTSTPEDGLSLVTSDPSYSSILLDWDLEGDNQFDERAAMQILRAVRRRNKKMPIFLIADRTLVSELPLEVVKQVHEYIHLFGDTPAFIANRVDFAVERYHETLLPPYFAMLKKYTDQGAYSWDAPGHMGGVAFLKHPIGMEFHKFFGENILRSDLGISTAPLGSWLDHIGPPGESERNAARIFGADWTFYVLNGSSTSNQIVAHGIIAQDDIVLADANCHKSVCHALTVTGARPVYFKPTRNGYGMIGLVPLKRFQPENVRQLIKRSPFSADASSQTPPSPSSPTPPTTASATTSPASSKSSPNPSPASTSTRPGTPTPSSTPSTATASPWTSPTTCPTAPPSSPPSPPSKCSPPSRRAAWSTSSSLPAPRSTSTSSTKPS